MWFSHIFIRTRLYHMNFLFLPSRGRIFTPWILVCLRFGFLFLPGLVKRPPANMMCCLVAKLCPILLWPHDCSPPGSSVPGTSRARILEWLAISFSRAPSPPRDWTHVSCISRWIVYHGATRKAQIWCERRVKMGLFLGPFLLLLMGTFPPP